VNGASTPFDTQQVIGIADLMAVISGASIPVNNQVAHEGRRT